MIRVVGVRTLSAGKSYYYDPEDVDYAIGTDVIVETDRGVEFARISIPTIEMEEQKLSTPLKRIMRRATDEDREKNDENRKRQAEAYKICQEKIRVHGLDMKLIDAEYTFDRNKLLFYFTADGRVDFRELVKDLASIFRTRIELRQVGVRDETKILGGLGICGRELCCRAFLTDFAPVSIKMAKEQNLSLNPTKISGVCGRLMCCLNNEEEAYEFLNKTMPKNGDFATTEDGEVGVIINVNILKQSVVVLFEEDDSREVREYRVEEIRFTPKRYGRPEEVPSVARTRGTKGAKSSEREEKFTAAEDAGEEANGSQGDGNAAEKRKEKGERPGRERSRSGQRRRDNRRGDRGDSSEHGEKRSDRERHKQSNGGEEDRERKSSDKGKPYVKKEAAKRNRPEGKESGESGKNDNGSYHGRRRGKRGRNRSGGAKDEQGNAGKAE